MQRQISIYIYIYTLNFLIGTIYAQNARAFTENMKIYSSRKIANKTWRHC